MPSPKALVWLHRLIWVYIYGGLLLLLVGLKAEATSPATGWWLMVGGGALATLGLCLIWVRSRLSERTIDDSKEKNP